MLTIMDRVRDEKPGHDARGTLVRLVHAKDAARVTPRLSEQFALHEARRLIRDLAADTPDENLRQRWLGAIMRRAQKDVPGRDRAVALFVVSWADVYFSM